MVLVVHFVAQSFSVAVVTVASGGLGRVGGLGGDGRELTIVVVVVLIIVVFVLVVIFGVEKGSRVQVTAQDGRRRALVATAATPSDDATHTACRVRLRQTVGVVVVIVQKVVVVSVEVLVVVGIEVVVAMIVVVLVAVQRELLAFCVAIVVVVCI